VVAAKATARRGLIRVLTRVGGLPGLRTVSEIGMRVTFDQLAGDWDRIRADPVYKAGFEFALDELPGRIPQLADEPYAECNVLDVACGTGLASAVLHERFPHARVVGVDISEQMVRLAATNVPGVEFVAGTSAGLPFADGEFDLIVSVDGVFSEPELARVLAPDGAIALVYTRGKACPVARPVEGIAEGLTRAGLECQTHKGSPGPWVVWAYRSPQT
jgi:SAM-dependent methyltransferase